MPERSPSRIIQTPAPQALRFAVWNVTALPVRSIDTPGPRDDIALAHDLVEGFEAGAIIADEGYDADHFVGAMVDAGTERVNLSRLDRKSRHVHDGHLYRERNAEFFPSRRDTPLQLGRSWYLGKDGYRNVASRATYHATAGAPRPSCGGGFRVNGRRH